MADSDVTKPEDSAEKAYAAASSEATTPKERPQTDEGAEPVEFPAKPTRARKTDAADEIVAEPVAAEPVAEPSVIEVAPAVEPAAKPRPAVAAAKASKAAAEPAPKLAVKRAVAQPAPAAPIKAEPIKAEPIKAEPGKAEPIKAEPAKAEPIKAEPIEPQKPSVQNIKTAPKAAPKTVKTEKASTAAAPTIPFIAKLKEIPMDVTTSIKDAVNGAQDKAKEAFTKTSAAASEAGEFAKGNVEAFVESGKILASGLQELGNKFIADSKTAFETATADVKALSSVKSPTEFFQFQTDLLRRNFDTAVSYSTKTGEAVLKLTGDVIKPISGRVTLAVEKVKSAA